VCRRGGPERALQRASIAADAESHLLPSLLFADLKGKELLLDKREGCVPFGPEEAPARHGLRYVCERLRGEEHTIRVPDACFTLVSSRWQLGVARWG
jgi:hypothetical protein